MRLQSEGSDKEGLSLTHLSYIEHLLCAGCYSRPCGLSVKKSVEVLVLKELKFCWEEIDNNQMKKIMSKVSKENRQG